MNRPLLNRENIPDLRVRSLRKNPPYSSFVPESMNPVILALDEATLTSVQAIGGCAFPPSIISLMGIDFFAGRQVLVILEDKATAARWLTHRLEAVGCKPCVFPFFSIII